VPICLHLRACGAQAPPVRGLFSFKIVRLVEIRNQPGLLGLGYCYIAGSGITRRSRGASGKLRQTVVPRPGVDVIVSVPA
jgi:hypothetical protein